MLKRSFLPLVFIMLITSLDVYGQNAHKNIKNGVKLLNKDNFRDALPYFEAALQDEPDNPYAKYYAGICHLNNYSNKIGLSFIEQAYKAEPNVDGFVKYWLGKAYHYNYEYKKALKFYNTFIKTVDKQSIIYQDVKKLIKEANHGIELQHKPGKYYVENLGENVNSKYSEHSPILSASADRLVFTSRKESESSKKNPSQGDYFEDIVQVSLVNGAGDKPRNIDGLNSDRHESNIQLFDNDTKMLLYKFSNGGDLYVAERNGDSWSKPQSISKKINSKKYEAHGFISEDGNVIYFSSNNGRKNGDLDLFVSRKDENGEWQDPVNLGDKINTDYDEDSPFLTADGKTLYFSSTGHQSSGGFDIFKSVYDENSKSWSAPEHLSYPINTPGDDVYFTLHPSGAYGFISSNREGGLGGLDIYKIGIKQDVLIKGQILGSAKGEPIANCKLVWEESKHKEHYITEANNEGKYEISLPSDSKYKLIVKLNEKQLDRKNKEKIDIELVKEPGKQIEKDFIIISSAALENEIIAKNEKIPNKNAKTKNMHFSGRIDSNEQIENATLTVRDVETGEIVAKTKLNEQNTYNLNVQVAEGREYTVDVVSDGFAYNDITKIEGNNYANKKTNDVKLDVKLKKVAPGKSFVLKSLYFDMNSSVLNPQSKQTLNRLFKVLKDNPGMSLEISGHTDNVGDYNYNVWLSEKRAKKVADFLINKGVSKDRLPFRGFGPDKPVASNDDEKEGRELNRRTEIKILKL